jgi:predicted transcriptional regulator
MTNEHILKVGIAPMEQFKARTMAIARGEYKPSPDEPKIWFSSPESFAQVLSGKNQALLTRLRLLPVPQDACAASDPPGSGWFRRESRRRCP